MPRSGFDTKDTATLDKGNLDEIWQDIIYVESKRGSVCYCSVIPAKTGRF
jgi:hypothetical protein